jgi:hypothetical protein
MVASDTLYSEHEHRRSVPHAALSLLWTPHRFRDLARDHARCVSRLHNDQSR